LLNTTATSSAGEEIVRIVNVVFTLGAATKVVTLVAVIVAAVAIHLVRVLTGQIDDVIDIEIITKGTNVEGHACAIVEIHDVA
jgi:uncharacterized membrane protein